MIFYESFGYNDPHLFKIKRTKESATSQFSSWFIKKVSESLNTERRWNHDKHIAHSWTRYSSQCSNENVLHEERTAIASRRIYLRFTQEEVAQKLNISQATYVRMEQAKNLRQATRKRFAEALGLDESQLTFWGLREILDLLQVFNKGREFKNLVTLHLVKQQSLELRLLLFEVSFSTLG